MEVVGAHDRWRILWVPETRFGVSPGSSRRVVGWQAGRMGVIYKVLLGLLVLRSRRDRLPFGEAKQQARAIDSSDG